AIDLIYLECGQGALSRDIEQTFSGIAQVILEAPFSRYSILLISYRVVRNQGTKKCLNINHLLFNFLSLITQKHSSPQRKGDCSQLLRQLRIYYIPLNVSSVIFYRQVQIQGNNSDCRIDFAPTTSGALRLRHRYCYLPC